MPIVAATEDDRRFMRLAVREAETSLANGSLPVGSVIVRAGEVVAAGRNRAFETNDPTSHAETDCLRNAGMLDTFGDLTLYTTLSPCMMCTGAMLFLGIPRIVIGDRQTYPGDVDFLVERGLEVVLLDDPECIGLMRRFITERPEAWNRIVAGDRQHGGHA